jgi:hypothetical protein
MQVRVLPVRVGEGGQASVELVALLPLLAVVAMLLWQAAVAGEAVWLSGSAARAAARAGAVGRDPLAAARGVLPGRLRRGARVRRGRDGAVAVRVGIPSVFGARELTAVTARARFAPQGP